MGTKYDWRLVYVSSIPDNKAIFFYYKFLMRSTTTFVQDYWPTDYLLVEYFLFHDNEFLYFIYSELFGEENRIAVLPNLLTANEWEENCTFTVVSL